MELAITTRRTPFDGSRPAQSPRASLSARPTVHRLRPHDVARERSHPYDADPSLRGVVRRLDQAARDTLAALDAPGCSAELGSLVELTAAIDRAQAACVRLVGRIQDEGTAARDAGLSLDAVLSMHTRMTSADRRTVRRVASALRSMPNLAAAFEAGQVGFAEVRAVTAEASRLGEDGRAAIDEMLADRDRSAETSADALVDQIRAATEQLRAERAEQAELRRIERRFLAIQPQLDGALTLYGELDAEAGATLLAAIDAAAPEPTADRADHGRDALPRTTPGEADELLDESRYAGAIPGLLSAPRRRARQRADGLVALAEAFLAGRQGGGTPRRARPRVQVVTDVATLAGHDELAAASRLLWSAYGASPSVTPAAVRRLASDADLQFVLMDGSQVLGVAAPTSVIPARVRAAIMVRDRGCRFPGCAAPFVWCDLHHVVPREQGGHTTVDNLVALCRRHHTAVTQGRWRLSMDEDATVTVRRGRRQARSRSPARATTATGGPPDRAPPPADHA